MKKLLPPLLAILAFFPTTVQAQCDAGEIEVTVEILTDAYGYEIYWALTDSQGDTLLLGGEEPDGSGTILGNNVSYSESVCLSDDECLRFDIYDDFGDGILGAGGYSISVDGTEVASGGDYDNYAFNMFNCPPGSSCTDAFVIAEGSHTAANTDTWYSFTPAQNGTYSIEACSNSCDSKLWVYEYCDGLIPAEDNTGTIYYDNDQGGCGPQAMIGAALLEEGVEYWIRIGSDNGDCTGSISWSLTYNGPVVGCMDAAACNFNPLATVTDGNCIYPGDPACPDGPDLIVLEDVLSTSLYMSSMNVPSGDCQVQEGCMNGYGERDIIRFTTHIQNIGNIDYYIGSPSANPDQFDFVNCHNHTHYKGYAEYKLYDVNGIELPIGFKNGFCVMDLECSGGGSAQYGCSTMGISAGCGDIYSSGLSCQWIDITDIDTGIYTFVNTTNWDNDPDGLGNVETNLMNNWAQLCIYVGRDVNGAAYVEQLEDCDPYVDCNGQIYGPAQPDCQGICGGPILRGDINVDTIQNVIDAHMYVADILANDITATECNDLNGDGDIDVYDAALLVDCSLTNEGHVTGSAHDHCNFPYGITNIFNNVQLSIGHVDHNQQFIDIHIQNPDNFVAAYQFEMSGITIESIENLVDPTAYPITPEWSLGGTEVIGISYQDSLVPKYQFPTPLCRIHYFSLTDTLICIADITSIVNQNYEETVTSVDAFNTCFIAYTGIDELDNGGIELSLFPNPMKSTSTLKIENRFSASINIEIIDPSGKKVRDYGNVTGSSLTINKNELSAGIYFIQITNENRVLNREKLIVQ